jgi:hypothetical protein
VKAMTAEQQRQHGLDVAIVRTALRSLDNVSEDNIESESIAVARARLQDWLDDNEGRWVA